MKTNDDFNLLFSLEEKLIDAVANGNKGPLQALLAEDFLEIGCSGKIWTKEVILKSLDGNIVHPSKTSDFKARVVTENVIQITFKSQIDSEIVLRSSIWKRTNRQWRIIFHQGTKAAQE